LAAIFIDGQPSGTPPRMRSREHGHRSPDHRLLARHPYVLNGRIDDVRLYNRALSNAEILAIAQGGQGPNAPTSLTATAGSNSVTLNWAGSARSTT
jgi:hypothetical protein